MLNLCRWVESKNHSAFRGQKFTVYGFKFWLIIENYQIYHISGFCDFCLCLGVMKCGSIFVEFDDLLVLVCFF